MEEKKNPWFEFHGGTMLRLGCAYCGEIGGAFVKWARISHLGITIICKFQI